MAKKRSHSLIGTPVAEGVRFEIGETTACAVRNEHRDIAVHVQRDPHFFRELFGRIPLIRGIVRLFSSIGRFFGGLSQSAEMQPQEAIKGRAFVRRFAALFRTTPQRLAALVSGLLIPILLLGPTLGLPVLAELALNTFEDVPRFAVNAVCCVFRIAGLVLGVGLVAKLKVVNRLCMYRGAASKVLNAYEAYGPNLSHEEVILSSRLTDESDGVFCLMVAMISIVVFACFRTEVWWMQLAFRLGVILASAAVVNELIRPLEKSKPDSVGAALRKPLTSLQQLFTIEPHNQMIEVAVCAFRAAYDHLPHD